MSAGGSKEPQPTLESMVDQFMRQDNISYVRGLRAKVTTLIDVACDVLDSGYEDFKDFEANHAAMSQLKKNAKVFDFEAFQDPA